MADFLLWSIPLLLWAYRPWSTRKQPDRDEGVEYMRTPYQPHRRDPDWNA